MRSEMLMVIATCCSAVAAGGSVWAAFRLEAATYQSQLYGKQVDIVAKLYPELTEMQVQVDRLLIGGLPQDAVAWVRSHIPVLDEQIREALETLSPIIPRDVLLYLLRIQFALDQFNAPLSGRLIDRVIQQKLVVDINWFLRVSGDWDKCLGKTLKTGRPIIEGACTIAPLPPGPKKGAAPG